MLQILLKSRFPLVSLPPLVIPYYSHIHILNNSPSTVSKPEPPIYEPSNVQK